MGRIGFIFDAMFVIVPVIVVAGFVLTFAMIFSPRVRAWFMGKQVKAVNYVVEDNKDELKNIADTGADISVDAIKRTTGAAAAGIGDEIIRIKQRIDAAEDSETENAPKKEDSAPISHSVGEEARFCSYCGAKIEADSVFCHKCGKKLN